MKLTALILILGFVSWSFADGAKTLGLVYPTPTSLQNPVTVQISLDGENLTAQFTVRTPTIYDNPTMAANQYPYMYDVVELFVSATGTAGNLPYYEFEVSPLDQEFEVKIFDPKTKMVDGVHMGLIHSVTKVDGGWNATLIIPLSNLSWDGDATKIFGNAYAVLGQSPARSYWSLFPLNETKPNFHRPDLFRNLLN